MKSLRLLLVLITALAITRVGRADDFQMVVIDPQPIQIPLYDIQAGDLDQPFSVSFSTCQPGELPTGSPSYQGCIDFLNGTGQVLTGLTLSVPDALGIVGQTADCPSDPNNIFSNLSCPSNPLNGTWTLSFTGGSIAPGQYFVIAENGADPSNFPDPTATFTATPEPGSIWLLSTGALLGGFLATRKRVLQGVSI